MSDRFTEGYYCAVAALIKSHGAGTEARELARMGGELGLADPEDYRTIVAAFPELLDAPKRPDA